MGQHWAAYHITDGVDTWSCCQAVIIDGDKTPLIGLQTDSLKVQFFCVWDTANGDNQLVTFKGVFGTLVVRVGDADAIFVCFSLSDPDAKLDVQPLP